MALERSLTRKLDALLTGYLDHWAEAQRFGVMPDRHVYAGYVSKVLLDHYARVFSTFTGQELVPDVPLEAITNHAPALRQKATLQAGYILNTIDQDLAVAHMMAAGTKSAGVTLETKKDARGWSAAIIGVVRKVKRSLKKRIPTMSNVNTNGVAEAARGEAAANWPYIDPRKPDWPYIDPRDPDFTPPDGTAPPSGSAASERTLYKRWITKGDEKVRASHVAMHGMMEHVADTFTVGGFQMMQPGDESYGAPLTELINCRCWMEYYQRSDDQTVPEEDGTYDQLNIQTESRPTRASRRPGAPLGSNIEKNPTSSMTFTGQKPRRAGIYLGNGEAATAVAGNGAITVRVGRRVVAEGSLLRSPDGTYRLGENLKIDDAYRLSGAEQFIRNSVNATNQLIRSTP